MIVRFLYSKLVHITLGFAILIGLLPMSRSMLSMQVSSVGATISSTTVFAQNNTGQEHTRHRTAGSCCDEALDPSSLVCVVIIPQSNSVALSGGSQRAAYSTPVVQAIYIEAATLPPKV